MQHRTPSCQLGDPETGDSSAISATTEHNPATITAPDATPWHPVRGDEQELAHTSARRTGPRRWLRAVTWLIAAGLHPRANATTQRLADDLAARMDYDAGHAVYDLNGTAARLLVSRATIKRHAKVLRELGALVFVTHGSQRNSRRARGLDGYAGTATIYAATIPAAYDHAMGHRIVGSGYTARIVIDHRGQTPAKPVDNSQAETGREPLSLTVVKGVGQVQVVGGVTTSGKAAANDSTTSSKTRRKRRTILGATVTAAGAQLGNHLARLLRSRFPWLRTASHDQVRWICADMGERGWTEQQATQFVSDTAALHRGAGLSWQPAKPHALLAKGLRQHEEQRLKDERRAAGLVDEPMSNEAWEKVWGAPSARQRPEDGYSDDDRRHARLYAWDDWAEVAAHVEDDFDDAMDLYGPRLCQYAVRKAAEAAYRQPTYA